MVHLMFKKCTIFLYITLLQYSPIDGLNISFAYFIVSKFRDTFAEVKR